MKKLLVVLLMILLSSKISLSHGFGAHAAHLPNVIALNSYYHSVIVHPRYQPYFIYGAIFPDIQYSTMQKPALLNLYNEIKKKTGIKGLTYQINMNEIPDPESVPYPFGIDTHDEKYGLAFAEYLLQMCVPIDPVGPNPGSDGTTHAHDAKNMKLAFALGYYLHLSGDIAAHNFLVPKVTSILNLGDIELIKNSQSFVEDPNAQMEGFIEGIVDHYYGDNNKIADVVFNHVWVASDQIEPTIVQMDFTTGYPHLFYNGPNPTWYEGKNPVLIFFHQALLNWYNNNPFLLPPDYKKSNSPLSQLGLTQLATVFRFGNRFYPSVAGHPIGSNNRLDQVLGEWVANHIDYEDWADPVLVLGEFVSSLLQFSVRERIFTKIAYPSARDDIKARLYFDVRTLISLMLGDMAEADRFVNKYPDKINVLEYNKLKSSILFTNPTSILNSIWTEYKNLGTIIYDQVGPPGKWYSDWSPWHKQTMAWGVYSSLNNLLPEIYTSNPNVSVYDAYFEINGVPITKPQLYDIFQNNPNAKVKLELFNISDVPSQNITMRVKKDHISTNYNSDQIIASTTFSIDQNPLSYNTVSRLKTELPISVSISDLVENDGYYFELVDNSSNKAMFTSSFEQYSERLPLTANYFKLYGTYEEGRWPISLGVTQNVVSVSLSQPEFIEGGNVPGVVYKINNIESSFEWCSKGSYYHIEAVSSSQDYIFCSWSDGVKDNPRNYRITSSTELRALYKLKLKSNSLTATAYNNSRKISRSPDGKLYSVYESSDAIFFIESTDNGTSWSQEILLSNMASSNVSYINPAIARDNIGNIHVVYEEAWNASAYGLYYRWRNIYNVWSTPKLIENPDNWWSTGSTTEQHPSISAGDAVAVAWSFDGWINIAINPSQAEYPCTVFGTGNNCEFPSIVKRYRGSAEIPFTVVWSESRNNRRDIYLHEFYYTSSQLPNSFGTITSAPQEINLTSSQTYLTDCTYPSIDFSYPHNYITFSAMDGRYAGGTTKSINFIQFSDVTYSIVSSSSWAQPNVTFDYPSISINSDGKANIVFQDVTNNNSMWVYNSTNSIPRILEKNSYYPSTIENDVPNATYLFTSGTSAPYQITLKKHDVVVSSQILSGWNMLSVPNIVHDFSKTAVWSGANSAASAYIPGVGYVEKNSLENRIGYWVSFPSAQTKDYAGFPLDSVNIPVVNVGSGWNIIGSISHDLQTSKIHSEPANIIASRFFGYNSGYYISDFIKKGNGYFVKVNNNGKIILDVNSTASSSPPQCSEEPSANPPGAPPQVILSSPANGTTGLSTTLTLSWNVSSGATSYSLQVSSDPCFTTFVFIDTTLTTTSKQVGPLSYSTTYYWRVKPKNNVATGIWSNRWNFTIRSAPYIDPCAPINELSAMDQFSITDNKGNMQSIYAHNGGRKLALGLNDFDMPPSPPKGIFDARFKSGKFIEILVPDQSKKIKPIKIKDAQYPISFSWIVKEDNKTTYWLITGKKEKISLLGSGNVSIDGLENGELSIEAQAVAPGPCNFYKADLGETSEESVNIPTEYGLSQNYPNPFNPVTQISYTLPEAGYVTLKVYDVLGREAAVLVDEFKEAGYYSVEFNGSSLSSGVYFYKLTAGSYTSVKKLLIMK